MNTFQREAEARKFKASDMQKNYCIEKEKYLLSYINGKGMLKVTHGESSKGYKNKI